MSPRNFVNGEASTLYIGHEPPPAALPPGFKVPTPPQSPAVGRPVAAAANPGA